MLANSRTSRPPQHRQGFTLVELLVVMTLMLVLAGIMVMFWPRLNESQRAAQGGALLQSWLKIAKQRALRDQAPRGVRLYIDQNNTSWINEAHYLEQPDDFTGGTFWTTDVLNTKLSFAGVNLVGINATYPSVEKKDYFEALGTGLVHRITGVTATSLNLLPDPVSLKGLPYPVQTPSGSYRIIRQPRVAGDEKLMFPKDVGIDLISSKEDGVGNLPKNLGDVSIDIMFTPAGHVIGTHASSDFVGLWVREQTYTGPNAQFLGEPSIIAVHVRSGLVAAHPPSQSGNPTDLGYEFVKDGGVSQ